MWKLVIVIYVLATPGAPPDHWVSNESYATEQACLDAAPDRVGEAAKIAFAQVGPVGVRSHCIIPGKDA